MPSIACVTEGLGIRHLRLVIGNSMGGMHTWLWGVKYPDFMDALVPMASQPTAMVEPQLDDAALLIVDRSATIPDWKDGNYTTQPTRLPDGRRCSTASPPAAARWPITKLAPTRERPTSLLDERLAAPFTADANDFLYQWDASRDYNAAPGLERIQARAAGHQLRRRRAQPAGDRPHGSAS